MFVTKKYHVRRAASVNKGISEHYRVTTNDFNPIPQGYDVEEFIQAYSQSDYRSSTCPRSRSGCHHKDTQEILTNSNTLPARFKTEGIKGREFAGPRKRSGSELKNGIFDTDLWDKLKESSVDGPAVELGVTGGYGQETERDVKCEKPKGDQPAGSARKRVSGDAKGGSGNKREMEIRARSDSELSGYVRTLSVERVEQSRTKWRHQIEGCDSVDEQARGLPEVCEKEYENARITVSSKKLRFSLPPSLMEISEAMPNNTPLQSQRPRSVSLGDMDSKRTVPKYENQVGVVHERTAGDAEEEIEAPETKHTDEDAKTVTSEDTVTESDAETSVKTEKVVSVDENSEETAETTPGSGTECDEPEKIVSAEDIVVEDGDESGTRTETVVKLDTPEDKDTGTETVVTTIDQNPTETPVEADAGKRSPPVDDLESAIDREEKKKDAFRYFEKLGREASLEGLKLRRTPEKSEVKEEKIVPCKAQRPRSGVSNFFTGSKDIFTGLKKIGPGHKSHTLDPKTMSTPKKKPMRPKSDVSFDDHCLHVDVSGVRSLDDSQYSPTWSSSPEAALFTAKSPRSPIKTNGSLSPSSTVRRPSPNSSNVSLEIHHAIDTLDSAIASSCQSSVDSGVGSDPARQHGHFVVVAIDFGTTYSGYAFSFTKDPSSIHMMRKWEGGDPGVINQKTPTTLLLKPDEMFHSFGFTARDHFHDLDPQEAKKWLYFEKFKMLLHHDPDLNEKTLIPASNGKEIPAVKVFAHSLMFFRDHALQELSDQSTIKILNEDVRWVITVPAIWKQPAKQFMRQAAYKAGIASPEFPDQLLIALEPEAASIYCRRLRMYQLVPETPVKQKLSPRKENLEPMNTEFVCEELRQGTRYMVVDCGGGTVDITVHQLDENAGKLRELHKATGGPHGSVGVDKEFERLLIRIFGQDFVEQFRAKRPAGYVDLMIAFESRKRAASPYKENPLNVSLPFSFIDYYKKNKGCPVDVAVRRYNEKYNDKDVRWSSQGMLRLSPEAMRRLFQPTLEKIIEAVGEVLNHPDAKGVQYVFLVGGFAESPILQVALRREFGHIVRLIIPQDMGLTILKGAVSFGLDPTVVSLRKSRLTYGVGVLNRFNYKKHPKEKLVKRDGIEWCTDVFDKFVSVNQPVALGDTVLRSYTPAKPGQKQSIINIYCTDREKADFITDRGVKICGTLILDLRDTQYQSLPRRREIQARMLFGDTEIKVSALDVATGRCVKAAIDFLNK